MPTKSWPFIGKLCEQLLEQFPTTQFRLHANVKTEPKRLIYDLSCKGSESNQYFKLLAYYSKLLHAPCYSLHAGYSDNCCLGGMISRIRDLEDWFDAPVAVEGGYPTSKRPQLLSSWEDYEWLSEQSVNFVVDLSHLNIIRHHQGCNDTLVQTLLDSQRCIEIHISNNDGRKDSHYPLKNDEWWSELLTNAKSVETGVATIFSEGNQLTHHINQLRKMQCRTTNSKR